MKCLICKKTLNFVRGFEPSPKERGVDRAVAIDDGGTVEISFGYGSSLHDCKTALGFICDSCFSVNHDLFINHYNGLG